MGLDWPSQEQIASAYEIRFDLNSRTTGRFLLEDFLAYTLPELRPAFPFELLRLFGVGAVNLRIMFDLARLYQPGIKSLILWQPGGLPGCAQFHDRFSFSTTS